MTSGADLFVVCKQCGSEVSPYITECPYCGNRLRRRAPKLPRANAPTRTARRRTRLTALLGRPRLRAARGPGAMPRTRVVRGRWAAERPYATILLVAASCAVWVVWHAKPDLYLHMAIVGPLHGDWWKLFTSQFAYINGVYAFVALLTVAIFGWLLERRHGSATVLALFLGAGASGALVACAVYSDPIVSGANGAGLALLVAWAVPDLEAARAGDYYEGDLLGAGALAALLLAVPFARPEASWSAGVVGGLVGLLMGFGMHSMSEHQA
jgi:membrane associated rhomboid family serine protease